MGPIARESTLRSTKPVLKFTLDLVHYRTQYWTMNRDLNIHEAKTHLSRYLTELKDGERILLCRRNRPIAEIRLLSSAMPAGRRPIGLGKGSAQIPDTFFDPIPEELTAFFECSQD